MTASELFKAGHLANAIDEQLAEVKAKPSDAAKRLFLFEMLLFAGDVDRAAKQGDLVKFQEVEIDATMAGYLKLCEMEKKRRQVLRQGTLPGSFGQISDIATKRVEALGMLRDSKPADAAALLEKNAPATLSGTINGKPFEGLVDCDDIFAPLLEVVTSTGYYWVPLANIRKLKTNPPKFPRDLYWLPAHLDLGDQEGPVFLPALYPFSHESADDAVKLGRKTDWVGGEGTPVRGLGQRTFLVGDDALGLLDIRDLEVQPPR